MRCHQQTGIAIFTLFAALAMPLALAAQDDAAQAKKAQHHHYKLIDVGTFGGPNSFVPTVFYEINGTAGAQVVSNQGIVTGSADTSIPDPLCFFDDCFFPSTFQWQNGTLTNLGALPGSVWSSPNWISNNGLIAGLSENGENDPVTGTPEARAVLWQGGQIINLGTLAGGSESFGEAVNSRGQVVGLASNGISDPYSYVYYQILGTTAGTQGRAFLWDSHNGMQDLGTLGGPDAWAGQVNESGQVAGISYTSFTANTNNGTCAPNAPAQDPFYWDKHNGMIDIGSFGGTCGITNAVNNRGQVAGQSYLAGNTVAHAFLWSKNGRPQLKDLGTLGGDNASALWVDEAGNVVGYADLPPNPPGCSGLTCQHHGFLWKNGVMTDLGSIGSDPCSRALSTNTRGQIVGASAAVCGGNLTHGFLWESGGPAIDLNSLVTNADIALTSPVYINNRGEIAGYGALSNGDTRAFVLIPCDDDHPGVEGCDYSMMDASAAATAVTPLPVTKVPNPFIRGNPAMHGAMNPMLRRFGPRFGPWYRGMGAERPAVTQTSAPLAGMTRQTTTDDAPEPELSPEIIPGASSDLQVDDLISARDRAEVTAGLGLTSDAAENTLSCPVPVCSPNHVNGPLCGVRDGCYHGVALLIFDGYDRTYRRHCRYYVCA